MLSPDLSTGEIMIWFLNLQPKGFLANEMVSFNNHMFFLCQNVSLTHLSCPAQISLKVLPLRLFYPGARPHKRIPALLVIS